MSEAIAAESISDLPLGANLTGKWVKILGLVERPDRRVVQSYNDGRIKIVREKSVSMMTRHMIDKANNIDRPPTWRAVRDRIESRELWKAEVYRMYYRHHRVWGAHFYNVNNFLVQKNGGKNDDIDMLEDPGAKKRALLANQAAEERDRVRDEARQHRSKQEVIGAFLMKLSQEHKRERDVEHMRMKESDMFKQEQMRERARRQAIASMGDEESKEPPAKPKERKQSTASMRDEVEKLRHRKSTKET